MSVMIESTDELLKLLKKMNLKVGSVNELRQLLASINTSYNPEAARQKTGRQIGTIVPGVMAGAAATTSFFLLLQGLQPYVIQPTPFFIATLALIWGTCALVSTAAVIAGAVLSGVRRGRALPDHALDRPASPGEPVITNIVKDLSV